MLLWVVQVWVLMEAVRTLYFEFSYEELGEAKVVYSNLSKSSISILVVNKLCYFGLYRILVLLDKL